MDNKQWSKLIKDLRDAIKNAQDAQVRLTDNNTEYTATINNGFKLIQDTIHEIDDLIRQLTNLIAGFKRQIGEFEATDQQTPRLTAEIAELQKQLNAAQETQRDAVVVMQDSIAALNANNDAMNTTTASQNVDGLKNTMTATTTSLKDIKTRLEALLNATPINNTESSAVLLNRRDQQQSLLPDNTLFELPDSDDVITYGDLKQLVQAKITKILPEYIEAAKQAGKYNIYDDPLTFIPKKYNEFSRIINAVNVNQESIQNALEQMIFSKEKDVNGNNVLVLEGGKRTRRCKPKITKKQRKIRQNKTMKQKKGYRYNALTKGKKYTKSNKSKKRRNTRL